eukprot:685523-Pleurochrysis_carterae.AAC.1
MPTIFVFEYAQVVNVITQPILDATSADGTLHIYQLGRRVVEAAQARNFLSDAPVVGTPAYSWDEYVSLNELTYMRRTDIVSTFAPKDSPQFTGAPALFNGQALTAAAFTETTTTAIGSADDARLATGGRVYALVESKINGYAAIASAAYAQKSEVATLAAGLGTSAALDVSQDVASDDAALVASTSA